MGEGPELQQNPTQSGANFFRSAGIAVLILLVAAALGMLVIGQFVGRVPELEFCAKCAAMIGGTALVAFVHFRSYPIALGVVFGPTPGAAVMFFAAVNQAPSAIANFRIALVYALGFAAGILVGDRFVAELIADKSGVEAGIETFRKEFRVIAAATIAGVTIPVLSAFIVVRGISPAAVLLAVANAASILGALLSVSFMSALAADGEDLITYSYRARETWTRLLERIAPVAKSPWSWSVAGIFAVILVLAVFGSARMPAIAKTGFERDALGIFVVVFVLAFAMTRDWRRALSCSFLGMSCMALCAWGYARAGARVDATLILAASELTLIGFVPIAAVAARGKNGDAEIRDTIVEAGSGAAIGIAGIALALLPWLFDDVAVLWASLLAMGFSAAAALVFQPGLTGVLEAVVPRRRNLEERYRVR